MHYGIDIWAPIGTPIRAIENGTVLAATENGAPHFGGYGHALLLKLDSGFVVLYAHLNSIPPVSPDQRVSEGQIIGETGNTDGEGGNPTRTAPPHLHFEIKTAVRGRIPGHYGENNVDPVPWLSERGVSIVRGRFNESAPRFPAGSSPLLEALRRRVEAFPRPSPVPTIREPSRGLSAPAIGLLAVGVGLVIVAVRRAA